MHYGEAMVAIAKKKGLSYAEIARNCKVTRQYINFLKSRKTLTTRTRAMIAFALGVRVCDFAKEAKKHDGPKMILKDRSK